MPSHAVQSLSHHGMAHSGQLSTTVKSIEGVHMQEITFISQNKKGD